MKKQITIALFIAVLIGVYQTGCTDGQGEQEGSGTKTTMQTTKFEDARGDCTNGGVRIEVLVDGVVDEQYICNGINGQVEQNGTNTSIQTTKFEDAQGECTNGGVKIEVLVDGVVDDTQTQYLCNGAQGLAGSSTKLQATPFEDAQGECTNGGVKIEVLVDGVVDDTQTQYICHGVNGHDGKDVQNSYQALVMTSNDVGTNCAHGGIRIDSGVDKNNNNTLESTEIVSTRYVCNGANGADGQNGLDGTNGTNASIQTTPFDGAQGSCTHGGVKVEVLMDGIVQTGQTQYLCNGANGADGQNGAEGQNGHNALVATSNEIAGANCAHGGIRLDSGVDKNNNNTLETSEILSTRYVCNGANGADGQDGTNGTNGTNASIQTTPFEGVQGSCTNGGVKVEVLVDGVVQASQTQYICNGADSTGVCLTDNDCRETAYCDQRTLMCVDKKAPGESCTQTNQCIGVCLDNVCLGIGDVITFGHYEQDNDTTNGKEPIEWRVLDINDEGQVLIISEKVLDVQRYNTTDINITWEESTIRSWLNGYAASYNTVGTDFTSNNFIDAAFTDEEKAKIVASNVPAHKNPSYNITPGNETTDNVFLLSIVEAETYFTSHLDRRADATRYAIKKGVNVRDSSGTVSINGTCIDVHCYADWWLRSPGYYNFYAAYVDNYGSVYFYGNRVYGDLLGVRPALWIQY